MQGLPVLAELQVCGCAIGPSDRLFLSAEGYRLSVSLENIAVVDMVLQQRHTVVASDILLGTWCSFQGCTTSQLRIVKQIVSLVLEIPKIGLLELARQDFEK